MPDDPRRALPQVMEVPDLYWYRAVIAKEWHDADTVWVKADLGMEVSREKVKLRLGRIDAFGSNSPKKEEGAKFCNQLLPVGAKCFIKTSKTSALNEDDKIEKWGRYLVEVYIQVDDLGGLMNLNDLLVKQGFALYWEGLGIHPTGEIV